MAELLPDCWRYILSFIPDIEDVISLELTCHLFCKISRERISLDFYVLPWSVVKRYTRLRHATGLITGICPEIFESSIEMLTLSTDTEEAFCPYLSCREIRARLERPILNIMELIYKFPNRCYQLHDNSHDSISNNDRLLLFNWDPESLWLDDLSLYTDIAPLIIQKYRELFPDGQVTIRYGSLPSVSWHRYMPLNLTINPLFDLADGIELISNDSEQVEMLPQIIEQLDGRYLIIRQVGYNEEEAWRTKWIKEGQDADMLRVDVGVLNDSWPLSEMEKVD